MVFGDIKDEKSDFRRKKSIRGDIISKLSSMSSKNGGRSKDDIFVFLVNFTEISRTLNIMFM